MVDYTEADLHTPEPTRIESETYLLVEKQETKVEMFEEGLLDHLDDQLRSSREALRPDNSNTV